MRRGLLIIALTGMVLLAGCGGTGLGGDPVDVPETPTPDDPDNTNATDPSADDEPAAVDGDLEIHHIDVGQADSTLLISPTGGTILIDTGDWRQDGSDVIAYLDSLGVERIDHLVATHGHADHIGGHAALIEHYETERDGIGAAYDSGVTHTSQTYENYLDAIDQFDVELLVVESGDELPLADDNLSALVVNPPAGDRSDDLHENSVSLVVEFGDVRYLTTGDAEAETEARMLDELAEKLDVDVYQAGHHGSSTSSSPEFMDTISPSMAIVSSDLESQYGHPHDEVLEAFADRDIETYWTAVHGDILLTTDGSSIDVETSEDFSSDPLALSAEKPNQADDSHAIDAIPTTHTAGATG